jgi:putative Mg2+ transporter-C (MgtC) family protein
MRAGSLDKGGLTMDVVWAELAGGLPDPTQLARVILRLLTAMLVGAVVGLQREQVGSPAGLRTHMLVAMGGALFVLVPLEVGMAWSEVSRVMQGLIAGIGFLGGGTIVKWRGKREVHGLTTAAGLWMTAAIGVAAGLGRWSTAVFGAILTWVVLAIIYHLEPRTVARPQA